MARHLLMGVSENLRISEVKEGYENLKQFSSAQLTLIKALLRLELIYVYLFW